MRPISPHITYVPFYMPFDNKDFKRPDDNFIKDSWNCLKTINPHLKDDDLIVAKCNRYKLHNQYVAQISKKNYQR